MTYQIVHLPTTDHDAGRPNALAVTIMPSHGPATHTESLLLAFLRIYVLAPRAALCGHAPPLRRGRIVRVGVLRSFLRISREAFPRSDQGRREYLILKPVLILIILIIVVEILEIIVVLKVLELERAAGEVVDRTGNDLTRSGS